MKKRILTLASVLALVAMLATPMAALADATGTVIISGGAATVTPTALSLTGGNTLTGAELTATSVSTSNLWTANDPRGTGVGWNVTISSTDFGSPTNEVQTVTITGVPTGGRFTLTYNAKTTAAIAYDAAASAVQAALIALTNIESVTATGGPLPGTAVVVEFTDPGNQNVAEMTATSSLTGGTNPAVAVATTTPGVPGIDISKDDQLFKIKIADANIASINGSAIKPTSSVTSLTTITGTAMKIVAAAAATGMGNYNIPPEFSLMIPAETYADTYTATVTVAINSGP